MTTNESTNTQKPIVLATDFSPISDNALQHAAHLARVWDAPVRLVHVVEAVAPGGAQLGLPENIESRVTERVTNLLEERRAKLEESGLVVEVCSRRGLAADEILAEALRVDSRALVVGTHGYGGFRQFFVGSVATRVIRGTTCPVLAVPPDAPAPPWGGILFPADFSPLCDSLFETSVDLAKRMGAVLEIFHVEIPRDSALMAYGLGDALLYELSTERAMVDEQLGTLSARARQHGVTTTTARAIAHSPGKAIAERVVEADYGLIVMPSHGRRGFQRFVHGSVTEAVLRHTDRAMLVTE